MMPDAEKGALRRGRAVEVLLAAVAAIIVLLGFAGAVPSLAAPESGVEGVAALRGELVAGVVVLAFAGPGPGPGDVPSAISAGTDGNGRYRLPLKPGSYHLVAARTVGPPWPFLGAKGDLFCYYLGNPIVVEAGKLTRVAFNMVRVEGAPAPVAGEGSGVAGQVLFKGKALGRAYVYVFNDPGTNFRGMGLASVPAGEDGRFRVKLPPGRYYVLARKRQDGGIYGPPGKDDYVGYFPGNPVTVRAGAYVPLYLEATTRIDTLEESLFMGGTSAGWFEGTVTVAGGKPAAGLYVLFYVEESMSGTPAFVAGPTDAKGHFKVRAAAGSFHLLARSNLGGPLEAGEWYGKTRLPASGAASGEIRVSVSRFRGK